MTPTRHKIEGIVTAVPVALVALLVALGVACSLVLKIDDECTQSSDCAPGRRCERGLCVPGGADGDSDVDGDTDADQDGDAEEDADDGGGITPEELLTDECETLIGVDTPEEALDPDTILVGAIHPLTGDLAILGPYLSKGVRLAVEEINSVHGLPGKTFAVLECDSAGTMGGQSVPAATHLGERVRVPAIIGPFASQNVIDVYDETTHDAGVVIVSAGANSPIIDAIIGEDRLVWSTSAQARRLAMAMAHIMLDRDLDRVGVINRGDPWGNGMREAIQDVYCAVPARCEADHWNVRTYAVDVDVEEMGNQITTGLEALAAWGPDVVVAISYIEDGVQILNRAAATSLSQEFLTPDGLRDDLATRLVLNDEALCRTLGVTGAIPSGSHYTNFLTRYRNRYEGEEPLPYVPQIYDAVYLLGLAIAAATREPDFDPPLTGAMIADALARLSTGSEVPTGPTGFTEGVTLLRTAATTTIDYVGASGPVDFPEDGTQILADVESWHFNLDEGGPETLGVVFDIEDNYTPPDYGLATPDPVCEGLIGGDGDGDVDADGDADADAG